MYVPTTDSEVLFAYNISYFVQRNQPPPQMRYWMLNALDSNHLYICKIYSIDYLQSI